MITLALIFAFVMVLPVKFAADFTDGRNTSLLACLVGSLVAPVLAVVAFRLSSGGFNGFMLGFLALLITYVGILRIPVRSIIAFSVVLLALQGATFAAVMSFGVNIGKILLGHS